jgi:hypothetical protein
MGGYDSQQLHGHKLFIGIFAYFSRAKPSIKFELYPKSGAGKVFRTNILLDGLSSNSSLNLDIINK